MILKFQLRQAPFVALIFFVTILFINSCKKADSLFDSKSTDEIAKDKTPENFFKLPANASPVLQRIAKALETQNKTKEFITAFIAKDGFPVWNKASIESHKRKNNTPAFDGDGLADTIVYIPLVVNAEQYVHGFLKATVADTIDLKIFRQNDYKNFPFQTPISSPTVTTAENFALRMMVMDKDIFGSTEFKMEDKRMFNYSTNYNDTANIKRFVKFDSTTGENFFSNGSTINNILRTVCVTITTVNTIPYCGTPNYCLSGCDGCAAYCSPTRSISYNMICETWNEDEGGGGGNGGGWPYASGGGGGGGGGNSPGGGGPPCIEFGGSILNGVVPINCEPGPGGNPWPPATPQSWLDYIWMTHNLKDSTNNPCVAGVLSTLRSISSKLPELLRSVFDTSGTNGFDVTFKFQNLGTYAGGSTEKNVSNFDYKSKVNSFFSDATDLSVASTIIHEIFHCQLYAWYRKSLLLNDTALQNNLVRKYGYLFTTQYTNLDSNFMVIVNGPDVLQHQDIAVRYRNIIGEALYQFAAAKSINVTLEYCKDLAWSGCQDSRAFSGLSSSNQEIINKRIKAEKDPYGSTINDPFESPKGHPCL